MSDLSPILALPLIQPAQAQKHVTHNEAVMKLDLLVQLAVASRSQTTPPASPAEGARHIVPAGATGDWAGQAGHLALWLDGAWQFHAAQSGWRAWVADEEAVVTFAAGQWRAPSEGALSVAQLGVSASPDGTNRLAVAAPATLFNHAGAGHQVKLNKATAGDTAALLFQTGFSGRAELGTLGNDDLALKVSADGTLFLPVLSVAAADGRITLSQPARLVGQTADPSGPAEGTLWHNAPQSSLKLQMGGRVVALEAQSSVPVVVPPAGEFVMATMGSGASLTTLAGAANRLDLYPFLPRATFVVDALGVNCTSAATGAQGRVVVYSADANGRPADLLGETPPIDLSSTGNKTGSLGLTFRQGLTYWLGIRHSGNPTLSAWISQATPDINGGTTMSTANRKILRRTVTFADPAPANWTWDSAEISTGTPTAVWLRLA